MQFSGKCIQSIEAYEFGAPVVEPEMGGRKNNWKQIVLD